MPNKDITIDVWSWYWTGTEWVQDDHSYVDIALAEVVEPYKGTISRVELEYNQSQDPVPVSNIPQGERGRVHVWGRNDMTTTQRMGIHWVVTDPDGIEDDYGEWELWPYTPPGVAHEFYGEGRIQA
ncbi:unnamed protein product, partial [marine sediment metagenome]